MIHTVTSDRRRTKLTKTVIDRLEFDHDGPAQQVLWDVEIPNLGIRIYPTGKRTFVVHYSLHGRWRLMAVDRYGVITLDEARRRAKKTLGEVSQDRDPMEQRKRLGRALTVKELADRYNDYQKDRKKTAHKDKSRLDRWVVPYIGTRKADTIDLEDIQAIHDRISKKAPYEANRTVAMLSTMFNLAKQWKAFPPELPNPCKGVAKNREVSRAEYVPPEKLPDLGAAIDTEKDVYVRHCFWLLLLTGMRRGELLNTKWEHVDLKQKRIWLPETKTGQPRYVPLSTAAVELIKETPKMLKNEFLLPGHVRGRPLHNIDKPWTRIRTAAGVPRLRIHDLRRTAGSYMIQAGASIHAVKDVLGHQSTKTTEIYARLAEQQPRDAVEAYGKALLEAAKPRAENEQRQN